MDILHCSWTSTWRNQWITISRGHMAYFANWHISTLCQITANRWRALQSLHQFMLQEWWWRHGKWHVWCRPFLIHSIGTCRNFIWTSHMSQACTPRSEKEETYVQLEIHVNLKIWKLCSNTIQWNIYLEGNMQWYTKDIINCQWLILVSLAWSETWVFDYFPEQIPVHRRIVL